MKMNNKTDVYTTVGVSGAKRFLFCLTLTQNVLSFESEVRLDDAYLRQDF